jgi:Leucine-rich repeat (LRR) protein
MKNLFITFVLLFVSFLGNAQIVNIPDASFKAKLINNFPVIDTNNDGEIQISEALAINTLVIEGSPINDLTGVQSFSNLTSLTVRYLNIISLNVSSLTSLQSLNCSSNDNLTTLNVSGLTNLQVLNCYDCDAITSLNLVGLSNLNELNASDINGLTALDLSFLPNLHTVNISGCRNLVSSPNFSGSLAIQTIACQSCERLSNLNVTGLVNLQSLNCSSCDLATLDASNLPNLTSLNCAFNESVGSGSPNTLTTLNITGSYALTNLICSYNTLTSLDIANHTNLTHLECHQNGISSLAVNNLTYLTYLNCSNNNLTSLNVNNLTNLSEFYCSYNQFSTISVSNLVNLTKLDCSHNQITALNVTPLVLLTDLICESNQISSLNVLPLTQLTDLKVSNNPLNSIDVSSLVNLEHFLCHNSQLNSIDVTNLTLLKSLGCGNNPITSIDVTHQPLLRYFECSQTAVSEIDLSHIVTPMSSVGSIIYNFSVGFNPNLTFINLKNGGNYNVNLTFFTAGDCPNLHFICADEQNILPLKNSLLMNTNGPAGTVNINNISFNSYCSFTPGGTYNTINGTVTIDTNNNGCDNSDYKPQDVKVSINDGSTTGSTFTTNNGNYSFYTQTGNFTLTPQFQNPYFTVSPVTATLNFALLDGSTQTQDFCITPNGVHNDVDVTIIPVQGARPGFDAHYQLIYKNKGNQTLSGTVVFNFDDAVLDFVSATPTVATQTLNTLSWNYANLLPFESRTIDFILNVNAPTETPPVNIGDVLNYVATINPVTGDETVADNVFNLAQTVVGSYDPNDKTCLEGTTIPPSKVGDYLHYLIRFQNSGTAPAENIVVKDLIDTTKFDIASLQLTSTSHSQVTRITGNKVEFIFEGINLPAEQDNEAGSHGYVAFKIRTKNTLVLGNTVSNTANIYFDYNFPIVTNTASTTVNALGINEVENTSLFISPNPTKNNVNISSKGIITSLQLFDVQGRLIETDLKNDENVTFDLSDKNSGIYFLKVYTENGVKVEKVIKE